MPAFESIPPNYCLPMSLVRTHTRGWLCHRCSSAGIEMPSLMLNAVAKPEENGKRALTDAGMDDLSYRLCRCFWHDRGCA